MCYLASPRLQLLQKVMLLDSIVISALVIVIIYGYLFSCDSLTVLSMIHSQSLPSTLTHSIIYYTLLDTLTSFLTHTFPHSHAFSCILLHLHAPLFSLALTSPSLLPCPPFFPPLFPSGQELYKQLDEVNETTQATLLPLIFAASLLVSFLTLSLTSSSIGITYISFAHHLNASLPPIVVPPPLYPPPTLHSLHPSSPTSYAHPLSSYLPLSSLPPPLTDLSAWFSWLSLPPTDEGQGLGAIGLALAPLLSQITDAVKGETDKQITTISRY